MDTNYADYESVRKAKFEGYKEQAKTLVGIFVTCAIDVKKFPRSNHVSISLFDTESQTYAAMQCGLDGYCSRNGLAISEALQNAITEHPKKYPKLYRQIKNKVVK